MQAYATSEAERVIGLGTATGLSGFLTYKEGGFANVYIDSTFVQLREVAVMIDMNTKSGVVIDTGYKYYHTRLQYAIEIIKQAIKTGDYKSIWRLL